MFDLMNNEHTPLILRNKSKLLVVRALWDVYYERAGKLLVEMDNKHSRMSCEEQLHGFVHFEAL